jgi:Fur family ferric uptake transcriptional regulator
MENIHLKEKEQFRKLFRQEKLDHIEDHVKVLELFLQTEKHMTADELIALAGDKGLDVEPQFVKDTLKLMHRFGFAQKREFEDGPVRYEHRHLGQHHDHLICVKCGKIIEFHNETLENTQARIAEDNQFHMLQHKMEIYGICSDCLKIYAEQMPLTQAKPGEKLIIKDFTGGANIRMRLLTMGLRIGDVVEVITNSETGQLVLAMDYKRYALGRGMAQKVMVEHFKKQDRDKE